MDLPTFPRLKFIDFDARAEPRTTRWCIICQRDLKSSTSTRTVRALEIEAAPYSVHPDDEAAYDAGDAVLNTTLSWRDLGQCLIGLDCARAHGLKWTKS